MKRFPLITRKKRYNGEHGKHRQCSVMLLCGGATGTTSQSRVLSLDTELIVVKVAGLLSVNGLFLFDRPVPMIGSVLLTSFVGIETS